MAENKASVTFVMTKTKETKGTVVFGNDAEDAPVSRIYVTKEAVEALGLGESIKLTIAAE